jgi:integrase/recombinase XerD
MPNINPFKRERKALVVAEPVHIAFSAPGSNKQVINRWLHGRPSTTQTAYESDIARLLGFLEDKPLQTITLDDLQAFADHLAADDSALSLASQVRILKACKSLLTFAAKTMPGAFPVNAGAALRMPKFKDMLAERILDTEQVERIISHEPEARNKIILHLLYNAGLRRSELVGLRWSDTHLTKTRDGAPTGQLTVFGKGGKTRHVSLAPEVWQELEAWRQGAPDDALMIGLCADRVYKIVRRAAKRVGIEKPVSPHWMRHAHASHALDNGAPIQLVQATLGHANIATTGRYTHARPQESSAHYLKKKG